jgi:hypothetical protein
VLINTYLRNHSLAKRRGQLLKLNSEMLGKASRCDPHDEVNCWHPSMFNSFNLWRDGPLLNAAKPSSVTWCRRQYKIRVHLFTDFTDNVTWILPLCIRRQGQGYCTARSLEIWSPYLWNRGISLEWWHGVWGSCWWEKSILHYPLYCLISQALPSEVNKGIIGQDLNEENLSYYESVSVLSNKIVVLFT